MKVRDVQTNARTGEVTERWIESPDTLTVEQAQAAEAVQRAHAARAERTRRLLAADWTTLHDVPLSDAQRAAWADYRQALRDVTEQAGFPDAFEWPAPP